MTRDEVIIALCEIRDVARSHVNKRFEFPCDCICPNAPKLGNFSSTSIEIDFIRLAVLEKIERENKTIRKTLRA